jgi:hypothetical protein
VDNAIQETERGLAAARAEEPIRNERPFDPVSLPAFDIQAISDVLSRDLPELDAAAAAHVQSHVERLGGGGEAWIEDGVRRIPVVSAGRDEEICPFCAQSLKDVQLISIYRSYFSAAYRELKQRVGDRGIACSPRLRQQVPSRYESSLGNRDH